MATKVRISERNAKINLLFHSLDLRSSSSLQGIVQNNLALRLLRSSFNRTFNLYFQKQMKSNLFVIRVIAYSLIFSGVWGCLTLFPPKGDYMWEPLPTGVLAVINLLTTILFTLFVGLTARLARTDRTVVGILLTAVFIVFFCPGEEVFFDRDEAALTELASQCIAPFFISQYMRVSHKDFHRWYLLMFLMGIFCSYTHNGITIPLCCSFVWLAFQRRDRFFRLACWPMV